jgi:hypothetical protein
MGLPCWKFYLQLHRLGKPIRRNTGQKSLVLQSQLPYDVESQGGFTLANIHPKGTEEELLMRISKVLFSTLLALVILFTTVAPAIAAPEVKDTYTVNLQNKTGSSVRITLTGPQTVYLTLTTGKNKAELLPGTYRYSYDACGKTNTGNFKVNKAGATLTLPKCKTGGGGGAGTVKVKINNKTGGTMTMVLTGPQTYTFYIQPGRQQITVQKGTYTYTVYTVCGSATGTEKLNGGGIWEWWCY